MKVIQLICCVMAGLIGGTGCQTPPPEALNPMRFVAIGDIPLQTPEKESDRRQLGLSEEHQGDPFRLRQLNCPILVIEVFDMYCHICQASAENLNTLHKQLQNPPFNVQVCMMGIGRENTMLEVETFRRNLEVSFPLLPDPASLFAQAIPVVHTPHVMLLRRDQQAYQIIHQKTGYFSKEDTAYFLALIRSSERSP